MGSERARENYDSCKYILDCIREERIEFKPKSYFSGPLVLLANIQVEEQKNGGFGQLPILEGLELIENPKKNLKKKKSKQNILEIGSISREEELEQFKSKIVQALLLDTDDKIKIALDETPEDSDLKMIVGKRLAFFKELNHLDDDNAMVILDNGNDVPEESVKDNEEINREKDDEKVVDQDLDKPEDVEKECEFGNNELVNDELGYVNTECEYDNDSGKKELEKNTEDLIKGADVSVEINKKEVSKGVLAIYEDPFKDSQSETSIFDSQPEDLQPEAQDSQPGMEIGAGIQEENLEPFKNCETLEEANFPSIGLEDIESLKGGGRNLFDEKTRVQNVNEDDMILQDSLLNIPFLSTQEVACLEIITQKSPQIQKQGIPKSFHSNKLKLGKYVLPDAQATGEKRQEVMNDGMAECMKEKPIDEVKGKSVDFKDADKQEIKKPQVRKQTAAQLAKLKETKAKTIKPAPTKRKKKEPNDKEETAIHASPISFIPPPVDIESEKRQGKPSNFLVSSFNQRKVILDEPVSEEGKKIMEYIWSTNTPKGDIVFEKKKGFGIKGVYFLSLYPEIEVASAIIDLWTLVLNNEEQHRDKLSGDGNVYCHTVMMTQHSVEMGKDLEARRKTFDENIVIVLKQAKWKNFDDNFEIDIIDNINNGIDDSGFPCALLKKEGPGNDVRVDEELWKRFNETVIKTIDN
ncbi:hypothetical protein Tco_0520088 [Tanacetum coccineum]